MSSKRVSLWLIAVLVASSFLALTSQFSPTEAQWYQTVTYSGTLKITSNATISDLWLNGAYSLSQHRTCVATITFSNMVIPMISGTYIMQNTTASYTYNWNYNPYAVIGQTPDPSGNGSMTTFSREVSPTSGSFSGTFPLELDVYVGVAVDGISIYGNTLSFSARWPFQSAVYNSTVLDPVAQSAYEAFLRSHEPNPSFYYNGVLDGKLIDLCTDNPKDNFFLVNPQLDTLYNTVTNDDLKYPSTTYGGYQWDNNTRTICWTDITLQSQHLTWGKKDMMGGNSAFNSTYSYLAELQLNVDNIYPTPTPTPTPIIPETPILPVVVAVLTVTALTIAFKSKFMLYFT